MADVNAAPRFQKPKSQAAGGNQVARFTAGLMKGEINQVDAQLAVDLESVLNSCIYLPAFLCGDGDFALLQSLTARSFFIL